MPYLKEVWHPDDFQALDDLLDPVAGGLETCFSMRADILAYLLTSFRFHFTFSPFVTPAACPQLFHWMDTYSYLMPFVTLELDLSKLGFGSEPASVKLRPGNLHVDSLLSKWVDLQMEGRYSSIESKTYAGSPRSVITTGP